MSNFKCDKCGMTNVDCGLGVFKTPREIELEEKYQKLKELNKCLDEQREKYFVEKLELEQKLNAQFTEMEEKLTAEENKNFELKKRIEELETRISWYINQREEGR